MQIRIDDGSNGAPVYRQIVEAIKHQVATGALASGERLPTVRQLANDLHVDRNTALRAYRILQRDGVVSLEHGRGTFVRARPEHPNLAQHRQQTLEHLMSEGILRALSLGYAPQEIERAFGKQLGRWQRARAGRLKG